MEVLKLSGLIYLEGADHHLVKSETLHWGVTNKHIQSKRHRLYCLTVNNVKTI